LLKFASTYKNVLCLADTQSLTLFREPRLWVTAEDQHANWGLIYPEFFRYHPPMNGPQSYAPAVPGSIKVDPILLQRNLDIQRALLSEAKILYDRGDLRWFFTKAHGEITRLINENLDEFQRPDALLTLNIHFAEEFVRALWGQPHQEWKKAFQFCKALETASSITPALVGETEFCGAAMADVHIHIDLSDAIEDVGCIPPEDYGNMLVFVNRGSLAALVKLRGRTLGAAEAIVQYLAAPMIDLEVKVWRNTVYQDTCQVPVPDPHPTFRPRL